MRVGSNGMLGLVVACCLLGCCHCWLQERRHVVGNLSADSGPVEETDLSTVKDARRQIVPGTKWCGAGNVAQHYADLGSLRDSDECCREHDLCDDVIASGETKHGLHNDGQYTRLHCDCDARFWSCLYRVGSLPSVLLGLGYFDLLHTTCFRRDHPITGCLLKGAGVLERKCLQYKYDQSGEKSFQWFDSVPLLELVAEDPQAGLAAGIIGTALSLCPEYWPICPRRTYQDAPMPDNSNYIY